jgi:cold shock CspA family protein
MATGSVKWFNADKGYGFITPGDADRDLFVPKERDRRAQMTASRHGVVGNKGAVDPVVAAASDASAP